MELPENKDAIKKAEAVFESGKPYFYDKDTPPDYEKLLAGITHIFGGFVSNTGGGILLGVIPFDDHYAIGLNEDCVVLYYSKNPHPGEPYEIVSDMDADREWSYIAD
jgi:hypothetical protein